MTQGVISARYRLLAYLYTLLVNSHKFGTPVVRPLFFDYGPETRDIDEQFLLGKDLTDVSINAMNRD